jgi:hypothetical protein
MNVRSISHGREDASAALMFITPFLPLLRRNRGSAITGAITA